MHHDVLERWSRGSSPLHHRDPRVKVLATVAFLVAVATTVPLSPLYIASYLALLVVSGLLARLPLGGMLARACVVLPFAGTFAVVSWLADDPQRAVALVAKSYFSAVAVLLLVGTTPLPRLLDGLERMGVPRMIVLVVQFLYRYLFVISEQGQHMRLAALSRGGTVLHRAGFRAPARIIAVLFGKSYQRAEGIHKAMLARGFEQRLPLLSRLSLTGKDALFFLLALAAVAAIRFGWGSPS